MKKYLITLLAALLFYYFMLPPINLTSPLFYFYIFLVIGVFILVSIPNYATYNFKRIEVGKQTKILFFVCISIIPIILLINLVLSPIFNSKAYHNRITVENSNFKEDISEVDFNHIPLLDKDSSSKLGDRVMGEMTDLVSQFVVSDAYTQINYNDKIVRVTPLEYSSLIKYLTNRKSGIPAYITVDSTTGEAKLVRLEKGMKYSNSAILFENLNRYLRLKYPTLIFDRANFEIDNEGNPYFIVPIVKYTGIGIRKDITGAIILNPVNGKTTKYKLEDIPSWVDHVYNADLIIEQVNDWGAYKNGFLNTIFGQKEVVATTTGYNYTILNDDVYMYTGITSVIADESNIGFILSNLRTKETKFYEISGAEEYSAMASAEGQVQQMKYVSSFPLLINLNGNPTYLMSLKDNAGLVKMYAFVDVKDYQKVVVTDANKGILTAANNYINEKGIDVDLLKNSEVTVTDLKQVVIDGNTYYYFKNNKDIYRVSIKINSKVAFIKNNDIINVSYKETKDYNEIISINE